MTMDLNDIFTGICFRCSHENSEHFIENFLINRPLDMTVIQMMTGKRTAGIFCDKDFFKDGKGIRPAYSDDADTAGAWRCRYGTDCLFCGVQLHHLLGISVSLLGLGILSSASARWRALTPGFISLSRLEDEDFFK